nr:PDZ domain-containing protein [Leifsonia psychrotolerans]
MGVAVASGLILGLMPAQYVIEQPGPVFNTLGTAANADDKQVPLISIPDETTYPTDGTLNLLTVSVVGNPDNRLNWLQVAGAWFDTSKAVVPLESIFPANVTSAERDAANEVAMVNSQQDAVAAAFTNLGIAYTDTVSIVSLLDGSPATGILKPGDQVVAVNGAPVTSVTELRSALKANGAGTPAQLDIVRDGATSTVAVTPVEKDGAVVAGVNVQLQYQFPFDVKIELDRVGGPSAGMMFALGIIDKLSPSSLTGGENIAGTGTIDSAGTVGPIGGIQQKMVGAKDAGSNWFLAPATNCSEVTGHIPDGLRVFAVKTLDDALNALTAIRSGNGIDALPTCPTN